LKKSVSSVIVPTVERDVLTVLLCSIAIEGRMFSIESTLGLSSKIEKLPGVGAEGLHIAPLPLGMQRIEDQR
jgi:hypothetical protein